MDLGCCATCGLTLNSSQNVLSVIEHQCTNIFGEHKFLRAGYSTGESMQLFCKICKAHISSVGRMFPDFNLNGNLNTNGENMPKKCRQCNHEWNLCANLLQWKSEPTDPSHIAIYIGLMDKVELNPKFESALVQIFYKYAQKNDDRTWTVSELCEYIVDMGAGEASANDSRLKRIFLTHGTQPIPKPDRLSLLSFFKFFRRAITNRLCYTWSDILCWGYDGQLNYVSNEERIACNSSVIDGKSKINDNIVSVEHGIQCLKQIIRELKQLQMSSLVSIVGNSVRNLDFNSIRMFVIDDQQKSICQSITERFSDIEHFEQKLQSLKWRETEIHSQSLIENKNDENEDLLQNIECLHLECDIIYRNIFYELLQMRNTQYLEINADGNHTHIQRRNIENVPWSVMRNTLNDGKSCEISNYVQFLEYAYLNNNISAENVQNLRDVKELIVRPLDISNADQKHLIFNVIPNVIKSRSLLESISVEFCSEVEFDWNMEEIFHAFIAHLLQMYATQKCIQYQLRNILDDPLIAVIIDFCKIETFCVNVDLQQLLFASGISNEMIEKHLQYVWNEFLIKCRMIDSEVEFKCGLILDRKLEKIIQFGSKTECEQIVVDVENIMNVSEIGKNLRVFCMCNPPPCLAGFSYLKYQRF